MTPPTTIDPAIAAPATAIRNRFTLLFLPC